MHFEYNGLKFEPIGNILGGFKLKSLLLTKKIECSNYTHEDFYKVAKKNHASVDIFKVDDTIYCMPCSGGLFEVDSRFEKHLKRCSEYDRNYKWSREE